NKQPGEGTGAPRYQRAAQHSTGSHAGAGPGCPSTAWAGTPKSPPNPPGIAGGLAVLNKDGSFTGFIKVQLKLARPVSVPAAKRGPGGRPGQRGPGVKRRTSFYLPRGTVKHLHILSHTRASEVISALLRKFTVVDDPRKFALFERSEKDDQVFLRKLSDEEQPLRLRLLAGPSEKALSFVLKENDSGEVNWDAFTLPELHNFLRILQREEDEQVRRVRHRYARCRREMQDALAMRAPR
uniref:Ras association domain family member 1 n=1 Tax=Anas zonorhyncha TaxID=75864 RepID=A0A8B9ZZQ8_9AVES